MQLYSYYKFTILFRLFILFIITIITIIFIIFITIITIITILSIFTHHIPPKHHKYPIVTYVILYNNSI